MIDFVIAAHGTLADSLLKSCRMIAGAEEMPWVHTLNMEEGKSVADFLADAQKILDASQGNEFLLLVDLMSASPCNYTLSAFRETEYRLLSGVNLPMLIELVDNRDSMSLDELWQHGFEIGQDAIKMVHLD